MNDNFYQVHPLQLEVNQMFYVRDPQTKTMSQYKLLSIQDSNQMLVEVLDIGSGLEEVLQLTDFVYKEKIGI